MPGDGLTVLWAQVPKNTAPPIFQTEISFTFKITFKAPINIIRLHLFHSKRGTFFCVKEPVPDTEDILQTKQGILGRGGGVALSNIGGGRCVYNSI